MATGGSSFISKPARGWLHPDHLVSKEGITYTVKVSVQFPATQTRYFLGTRDIDFYQCFASDMNLSVYRMSRSIHLYEKLRLRDKIMRCQVSIPTRIKRCAKHVFLYRFKAKLYFSENA